MISLGLSVRPSEACGQCTSIFVRIPFPWRTPPDRDLTLRMKYDDGFVAYLNGVEVTRRHVTGEASVRHACSGHTWTPRRLCSKTS